MPLPATLSTGELVEASDWNDVVDYILGLAAGSVAVVAYSVVVRTTTYAASTGNAVFCSGTFTVTLPAAAGNATRPIWVINNGTGTITIGRTGSDTVGLATSQALNPGAAGRQGDSMAFVSDNISNWAIV